MTHYNENLTAHSGSHTIAAAAPDDNSAADDWLISKKLKLGSKPAFDFYARNLGTANSVFVGDNDEHSVTVLVSETGNTSTADFQVVMAETQMPYLGENEWNHFDVDLAAYAGKEVYVAVRHTTVSANWLAFFDDFTFTGLSLAMKGDVNRDGKVDVADIACIIDTMAGSTIFDDADVNGDGNVDVADIGSVITIMAQ